MGLSIRAYATHRGVSHTAVRKAVALGRLTLEPDGTIDRVRADRNWVQNADPSKAREAPKLKPVPTAAVGVRRVCLRGAFFLGAAPFEVVNLRAFLLAPFRAAADLVFLVLSDFWFRFAAIWSTFQ